MTTSKSGKVKRSYFHPSSFSTLTKLSPSLTNTYTDNVRVHLHDFTLYIL